MTKNYMNQRNMIMDNYFPQPQQKLVQKVPTQQQPISQPIQPVQPQQVIIQQTNNQELAY